MRIVSVDLFLKPLARTYSHHSRGPQADQTGRIHISDFRNPATSHVRIAAGPYIGSGADFSAVVSRRQLCTPKLSTEGWERIISSSQSSPKHAIGRKSMSPYLNGATFGSGCDRPTTIMRFTGGLGDVRRTQTSKLLRYAGYHWGERRKIDP